MQVAAKNKQTQELRTRRIGHIIDLMVASQWSPGRSTWALTKEWEVSVHTIRDYAQEAASIIRHAVMGHEEDILSLILAGIDHIRVMALEAKKPMVVDKDIVLVDYPQLQVALSAYEMQLKALGLLNGIDRKAPDFESAREALAYTKRMLPLLEEKALIEEANDKILNPTGPSDE